MDAGTAGSASWRQAARSSRSRARPAEHRRRSPTGSTSTASRRSTRRSTRLAAGSPASACATLVERGLSIRQIARECEVSATVGAPLAAALRARTQPAHYALRDAAQAGRDPARVRACTAGPPSVRVAAVGQLPLRALQHGARLAAAPAGQGDPRRRSRRRVRAVRLRPLRRRAALPSPRSSAKAFEFARRGSHARSRSSGRRRRSACYCAPTATRRSRRDCALLPRLPIHRG